MRLKVPEDVKLHRGGTVLERPQRRLGQGQRALRWVFTARPTGSPHGQSISWGEVAIVVSDPFVHLTVDFYINVRGSFF